MSASYRLPVNGVATAPAMQRQRLESATVNPSDSGMRLKEITGVLRRVEPLSGLSPIALKDLAEAVKVEGYEQDEMIYSLGEPANSFHLVIHGRVVISCFSPCGKIMMKSKGPYSIFGELFVDGRHQGHCQARAHLDTQLYRVGEPDFLRLCHAHPELAIAFARIITYRWKQAHQDMEDMIFLNARQRVLKLLTKLTDEGDETGRARKNPLLQFSQDELARFIGVTRERINVILQELEKDGIIQIRHRALRIDREKLERVLTEEYLVEAEQSPGDSPSRYNKAHLLVNPSC